MLIKRVAILTAVPVFLVSAALAVAQAPEEPATEVPSLTAADLRNFNLSAVEDVTGTDLSTAPWDTGINGEQAIEIVKQDMGVEPASMRIHIAQAAEFADSPIRDVWVVVVPGGRAPTTGPAGFKGEIKIALSGVVIDKETGRILRWFMRGGE